MPDNRTETQKRGIRRTVWILLILMAIFIAGLVNKVLNPALLSPEEMHSAGAIVLSNPRALSPFVLVDDSGQPFTQDALQGQWTLLFFGYATCPDVCPVTLSQLAEWYRLLEAETDLAADTRVVMVTVDPMRDTPTILHDYTRYFHPAFRGVTGEFLDIHRFAKELTVAFQKVPGGTPEHYLMDHTSHLVLVNPRGDYHAFFKPTDNSGPLPAFNVQQLLLAYRSVRAAW